MTYTREIAKIESTHLGAEGHGVFTAFLNVTYGTGGQGVGGYDLRIKAAAFIQRTLSACGVDSWEALKGRTIYVLTDETRRVVGIENLPTERGGLFLFADVFDGS